MSGPRGYHLSMADKPLTYGTYLRIPQLLELQKSLSSPAHHDEALFIIIHQVYELWFKLILHEVDSAAEEIDQDHVYEGTRRWFVGISRLVSCPDVPDIKVWIDGFQYADGHADRYIMVDNVHTDHPLPPGVLRDLIAALTAVADEVDLMASHDQDTV